MRPSASPQEVAPAATDESLHPRAGVSLHLVDDEGVLLDALAQKLYRANTTAAFIWCCIEDGASRTECAARLQHAFETSDRDARSYVAAAVDHWRALDLLAGDDAASVAGRAMAAQPVGHPAAAAPPFISVSAASYRLLDTDFGLRFASHSAAADMKPFLVPLAEGGVPSAERVLVDVHEDGERRALYCGDRLIERWAARDELVPVAKIALVTLALERSGDFGALHAGAVCRGNGPCVVIAGASGAGKSTMVAALAASGFRSLGDDTVVLARDTLAVRAIPFGICLKEGAWTLLSPRVPELSDQPVHQRLDGKRVKYFIPDGPSGATGGAEQHPVSAIVFPNRRGDGPIELVRVSHADALTRLASEFCPLGGRLDAEKIERLIRWVGGMTCLEMRYATLDDGMNAVAGICP